MLKQVSLPEKKAPSAGGKLNISGWGKKKSHFILCHKVDSEEWSKGKGCQGL